MRYNDKNTDDIPAPKPELNPLINLKSNQRETEKSFDEY